MNKQGATLHFIDLGSLLLSLVQIQLKHFQKPVKEQASMASNVWSENTTWRRQKWAISRQRFRRHNIQTCSSNTT